MEEGSWSVNVTGQVGDSMAGCRSGSWCQEQCVPISAAARNVCGLERAGRCVKAILHEGTGKVEERPTAEHLESDCLGT